MRATIFVATAIVAAGGLLFHPTAQRGSLPDVEVRAIDAPSVPLPPEASTTRIRKFSFIVYGDTRSQGPSRSGDLPPDGQEIQRNHSAVVAGMLTKARTLARTHFPVRFV